MKDGDRTVKSQNEFAYVNVTDAVEEDPESPPTYQFVESPPTYSLTQLKPDLSGHCANCMIVCYQNTHCCKALCCVCCLLLVLLCGALIPGTVMWHTMNTGLAQQIEIATQKVMGVQADVLSAEMRIMNGKTTIMNLSIHNPPNYHEVGPYFMTVGQINADVSWSTFYKSRGSLVDITHATLTDMNVYIERLFNKSSNIGDIWNYAEHHPLQAPTIGTKHRKYQIQTLDIPGFHVHMSLGLKGVPNTVVTIPPKTLLGLGVQQGGVDMASLIFLTTQAMFPMLDVKGMLSGLIGASDS